MKEVKQVIFSTASATASTQQPPPRWTAVWRPESIWACRIAFAGGLCSLIFLLLAVSRCAAGPHAGGTLLLHAAPALAYTDGANYCGSALPPSCDSVNVSVKGGDPVVFFVVAAFPDTSAPALNGVTFGVTYPSEHFVLLDSGGCGDFELALPEWPASNSGTAVQWAEPQSAHVVPIYWFAGYAYGVQSFQFEVVPHPTQGAMFADSSSPAQLDHAIGFGSLGFDAEGFRPFLMGRDGIDRHV